VPTISTQMAFTLVRFEGTPQHLTGIAQVITPREALALIAAWQTAYPSDDTIVFDHENHPIALPQLTALAQAAPRGDEPQR
jgi:hypothetical protein